MAVRHHNAPTQILGIPDGSFNGRVWVPRSTHRLNPILMFTFVKQNPCQCHIVGSLFKLGHASLEKCYQFPGSACKRADGWELRFCKVLTEIPSKLLILQGRTDCQRRLAVDTCTCGVHLVEHVLNAYGIGWRPTAVVRECGKGSEANAIRLSDNFIYC